MALTLTEEAQQALLAKLETLRRQHATIGEGIAEVAREIHALTSVPNEAPVQKPSAKATKEDAETDVTRQLTPEQQAQLLSTLETRMSRKPVHYRRPDGITFAQVRKALEADPAALWSLAQMENTGGEPDIVVVEGDEFVFADCSAESPNGRRNCVYDKAAEQNARRFNGNAVDMAKAFDVEIWSEAFYRTMKESGTFDRNTWSWVQTPDDIRESGYALFGFRDGGGVGVRRVRAHCHGDRGAWRGLRRVRKAA